MQHVKFLDLYSGKLDGPYCGNTPPPPIITTGPSIQIILESNAVGITAYYRGFQVRYRATTQPSSPRFRDLAGLWTRYQVAGGAPVPTQITTTALTRSSDDVDDNNNAAIDAVNNRVNNQNNNNNNGINRQNNGESENDVTYNEWMHLNTPVRKIPTRIRSTSSTRRNTGSKKISPNDNNQRTPPNRHKDKFKDDSNSEIKDKTKRHTSLTAGSIAAIVIAALALLAIPVLFMYRRKRKKNKRTESSSPSVDGQPQRHFDRTQKLSNQHESERSRSPPYPQKNGYLPETIQAPTYQNAKTSRQSRQHSHHKESRRVRQNSKSSDASHPTRRSSNSKKSRHISQSRQKNRH
ncbi:uncharacterized protein LOC143450784 isoform X2 [Clavelina lepadiformis]